MAAFREAFVNFTQSTTLHGMCHITDRKKRVTVRLLWLLALLLMVGIYLSTLTSTISTYLDHPTVTSVQLKTTDRLAFPSVTICNVNYARRSAIIATDEYLAYWRWGTNGVNVFNLPEPQSVVSQFPAPIDLGQMSLDISHQPEDMYLTCTFDRQPCNISSDVVIRSTNDLICHTFENRGKFMSNPGGKYGLDLTVNIEQYDYMFGPFSEASGIRVVVHAPEDIPDIEAQGFAVGPGTETLASVRKTVLKRLPEPYAKAPDLCEDTDAANYANPLAFFSKYSQSACRRECQIKARLELCGCVSHLLMDGTDTETATNTTICKSSGDDFECTIRPINPTCPCFPSCHETVYAVAVSSSPFPSINEREKIVQELSHPQLTVDNLADNVLRLQVFFSDLRYTVIEEKAQYSLVSLFGELGGQLGLCLGASALTMMEMLEFFDTALRYLVSKMQRSGNTQVQATTTTTGKPPVPQAW